MRVVLDTGILGKICHPKKNQEIANWFVTLLTEGSAKIFLPEISDYELRRKLIWLDSKNSILRLDQLGRELNYVPIETKHMIKAAELWSYSKKTGQPTVPMEALDGDVILAAQAISMNAFVLTDNKKHLERFVEAKTWEDLR